MSFLADPPLLYAHGQAFARLAPEAAQERAARPLGMATVALFWVVSVGLYLEQGWTRPLWKACRAEGGRDWMLNSGVFRIDWRRAGPRTHVASALIFATYPLWLVLGYRSGRRRRLAAR